jgi:hypothetical protein
MALYSLLRLLFLLVYHDYFSDVSLARLSACLLYGLRFDLTAIIILNLPFFLLHILLPAPWFHVRPVRLVLSAYFILINALTLLAACVDIGLYRFSARRTTSDLFRIMGFGEDFANTVPRMVMDYWYLVLLFFGLLLLLSATLRWSRRSGMAERISGQLTRPLPVWSFRLLLLASLAIGFRGGLQYRPITVGTAAQYGGGHSSALVLNTPFTIIKTWGKAELEPVHWVDESLAERLQPFRYVPLPPDSGHRAPNVVILLLESFGSEYIRSLNPAGTAYTPFLDSLFSHSLLCTSAFANAKRSIEGIPAVVAGIPALMNEPFITSVYAGNRYEGLASLLGKLGYRSVFFHGGTNGTMGFDHFTKAAGFERYFGRKEYNDDRDFDGNWGIYDGPFLQRAVRELDALPEPFLGAVFTLSSHHPYSIPPDLRSRFPEGRLPIHASIRYTDDCLRAFFKAASASPWYRNTVFVITADHSAESETPYFQGKAGMYAIPVAYFRPDGSLGGKYVRTTQQIDILPSVLDLVRYPDTVFAFGNSIFRPNAPSGGYSCLQSVYQLIDNGNVLTMDTTFHRSLYRLEEDPSMQHDLSASDSIRTEEMSLRLKAMIQRFNEVLLDNAMTCRK